MSENVEQVEPLLLERIAEDLRVFRDPALTGRLLTYEEEAQALRRHTNSTLYASWRSKSEMYFAEIEFCIANNLVRGLCAIAAQMYEQYEYRAPWTPVGFSKSGSYRRIDIEFWDFDVDTKQHTTRRGTLERETERGERYTLVVADGVNKPGCRLKGIVDILNYLGVPRTYLDGLYDMIDYALEINDTEYGIKRKVIDEARDTLIKIQSDIRAASQKLQSLKRSRKWLRARCPGTAFARPADMPPVPTTVMPLPEACVKYQECPGVYFIWDTNRVCVYVGKSKNIGSRLSGHHVAREVHAVSVLPLDLADIHYAELFYIWLCRPRLNREGAETAKVPIKTTDKT